MAIGQTPITVIGNLTREPELRFTAAGVAVASGTVASTEKVFSKETGKLEDGGTLFLNFNVWREQAEHLVESAQKGTRVVVTGSLKQRSYETKEGEKRTVYELQADEVAVSLRWATAKVARVARTGGVPVAEDPWASTSGPQDSDVPTEEPPF